MESRSPGGYSFESYTFKLQVLAPEQWEPACPAPPLGKHLFHWEQGQKEEGRE